MSKFFWGSMLVLAILLGFAERVNIRIGTEGCHFVYAFPSWTETPWFEIDTRYDD